MEDALRQQPLISEPTPVAAEHGTTSDAQFVALVERRSKFVFRVAYTVLRNAHDAEDVVQETFLKLYRSKSWSEIRDEPSFLARTAWRIAVGRIEKKSSGALDGDQPDRELQARERDPESAAIDADWNAIVHRFISALPEDLRQPLALSALEELDSGQIAVVMGIPEGTVRTRIMRARGILKQKLAKFKEVRNAN